MNSLQALDEQIRATTGGEPGAGLYGLLSMLAGQFLGVPRSAMPALGTDQGPATKEAPQTAKEWIESPIDANTPPPPTRAPLNDMSKDELIAIAENEGAEIHTNWNKGDIIDAIVKQRRRTPAT
jgi:hypothetical protein